MTLSEDPTIFLADFGVTVTSGSVSGLGILDMPGNLTADGMAISTDYLLRCQTSKFGGLLYGDEVTAGSNIYQVREVRLIDDGTFCEISLMMLAPGTSAVGRDPRESLKLDDLSDVELSTPTAGEALKYDGTKWVDASGYAAYIHNQTVAASTWTINHNLGFKPSVELFDSGSQEIDAAIVHTSDNQVVVTLTKAIRGFARLT